MKEHREEEGGRLIFCMSSTSSLSSFFWIDWVSQAVVDVVYLCEVNQARPDQGRRSPRPSTHTRTETGCAACIAILLKPEDASNVPLSHSPSMNCFYWPLVATALGRRAGIQSMVVIIKLINNSKRGPIPLFPSLYCIAK